MDYFVKETLEVEKAQKILSKSLRLFAHRREILKGQLLYLPYYLFRTRVEISQRDIIEDKVCVDALLGEFALFRDVTLLPVEDQNIRTIPFLISTERAREKGLAEFRKQLYRKSLKANRVAKVVTFEIERTFYYPYWIGYFRRKGELDFDVLDAVTGARQGASMKPVFIQALVERKNRTDP